MLYLVFAQWAQAEPALQTLSKFYPEAQVGLFPFGSLAEDDNGSFYGCTMSDYYSGDNGRIFRMSPSGVLTNLAFFDGTNGTSPRGLIRAKDGCFYGVAVTGGNVNSDGTVFKVTPDGILTTLALFGEPNGGSPVGRLLQAKDGNFYGMTTYGGPADRGTIFRVTTNGEVTTLFAFTGTNGATPLHSGLVQAGDDNLYGTTEHGGLNFSGGYSGYGTAFKISTNGAFENLIFFNGTNGRNPTWSGLALGPDGDLYGTTSSGGAIGGGTFFKLTTSGELTLLYSFDATNGSQPTGAFGRDGAYYGVTMNRSVGTNLAYGTVFKVTTDGVLKTLAFLDGTNGMNPVTELTLASDGNLYGPMVDAAKHTTADGAAGSIFRIVEPPAITSLTCSNNFATLSWSSFPNGIYRVEEADVLIGTNWNVLAPAITSQGSNSSYIFSLGSASEMYFRVTLLP